MIGSGSCDTSGSGNRQRKILACELEVIVALLPNFSTSVSREVQAKFLSRFCDHRNATIETGKITVEPTAKESGLCKIFILLCLVVPVEILLFNGLDHLVHVVNDIVLVSEPVVDETVISIVAIVPVPTTDSIRSGGSECVKATTHKEPRARVVHYSKEEVLNSGVAIVYCEFNIGWAVIESL